MTDKRLSVVIPAYNVGHYIADCIRSVVEQMDAVEHLHAIVIVDGATDDTLDRVLEVATGYETMIRIVVQGNAGLSAARNAGLDLVSTEYVTFLDGDDVWQPDYLATLLPLLSNGDPDLIEYDALLIGEDGDAIGPLKIANAKEGTIGYVALDDFLQTFRCYSWARIYRTDLVRRHPFPVGQRFEDVATTPWYYWYGRSRLSIGQALIGYRQRPLSILKTPSPQDVKDLAATAAAAASMYADTGSRYWQYVAHRAFQQACRRITWQLLSTWLPSIGIARKAVENVPRPPGLARWIQANATLPYTILLYFKRRLFE